MHRFPICLLLATAFPLTVLAEESPKLETWICQGSYQFPGEPVKTQNRTLVLDPATNKVVMKVDGTEFEGQLRVAGQDFNASFEVPGPGGERVVEEVVLGRMNGRLMTVTKGKDGARIAQFRGGCSPASPQK
jgi:hypothetical protein